MLEWIGEKACFKWELKDRKCDAYKHSNPFYNLFTLNKLKSKTKSLSPLEQYR